MRSGQDVSQGTGVAAQSGAGRVGFDFGSTFRGSTTHFDVYYETSLGSNGQTLADGVLASCEAEYNILAAYFGGINPASFNIIIAAGIGGAYHYGCSATDLYCDASGVDVNHSRMAVVAEEVEVFEALQNRGWDCSASNGEGLSRVLATEQYPGSLNGFASAAKWLNKPDRPDFVNATDATDTNEVSIGCSVLFLNYLRYQLGYKWQSIVQAGGTTLEKTYQSLTGSSDGLTPFKALLQAHYPPGMTYHLAGDNLFPVPDLDRFWATNVITFGYEDELAQIFINNTALAEVVIHLASDDTTVATVPDTITVPVGASSVNVPIRAGLFTAATESKSTTVKATYAGKTLEITVGIGPPALEGFTISPSSIEYGTHAIATLTLNQPSKLGAVPVQVVGDPGWDGIQSPINIPQGDTSYQFAITPAINDPYVVLQEEIYADSYSAPLTIRSSIVVGILYRVMTAYLTVKGGTSFFGFVSLENAVSTDTVVGLAAFEAGSVSPRLPHTSPPSRVVNVPLSVTVPAGETGTSFLIKTFKPAPPNFSVGAVIVGNAGVKKYCNLTVTV